MVKSLIKAKLHPLDALPQVETHFEEEGKALLSEPVIDHHVKLLKNGCHYRNFLLISRECL